MDTWRSSETIAKLAEALALAQGAMKPAGKGARNPHYGSRYADFAAVRESAREALSKHGIAFLQPAAIGAGKVVVSTLLVHSSGEWIASDLELPLAKADAQAVGSAITYARRYGAAALLGISADDDDDDGEAASAPQASADAVDIRGARARIARDYPARAAEAEALDDLASLRRLFVAARDGGAA